MVGFRVEHIARRALSIAERAKKVETGGKVSFSGFEFYGALGLLQDCVTFHPEVPQSEARGLVWRSLAECARSGKITADRFLVMARKQESGFLSRKRQRYVLITDLSASPHLELHGSRSFGASVTLPHGLPRRFHAERAGVMKLAGPSLHVKPPARYRFVRVGVSARSMDEAAEVALRALDTLRGIWNLARNGIRGSRETISGKRKPVNGFVLGPVHTVHLPSGEIERERWWYEPDYCGGLSPVGPEAGLTERIHRFQKYCLNRLSRIRYRSDLEEMIRRYNEALDQRSWETAFLKLWQVLELGTKAKNLQDAIRRTAFLLVDVDWHRAVLDDLRKRRNSMVHRAESVEAIERLLYTLKEYAELLLLFHLRARFRFQSLDEVGEFLELPTDVQILRKRVDLFKLALKFRENNR